MQSKWQIKLVLVLTLLGAMGMIAIIPYEITTLMSNESGQSDLGGIPVELAITLNKIIQILFLFILVLLGVLFQKRAGLSAPLLESVVYERKLLPLSKKWVLIGIVVTIVLTSFTMLLDSFVFAPGIETTVAEPIWWQGLLASLYGGITEELMLRLFVMTFIVWLFAKIMKKESGDIPKSVYYSAIILTTIIFGLGHLPATIVVFGELTTLLVIRALVLNGLLGIWFGYLYYRKGLEYAMIAHFSANILILVLFPLIMS